MGRAYQGKKEFDKALEQFAKCLELKKKLHGENSFEVAVAHQYLGDLYQEMNNPKEAINHLVKYLTIGKNFFPPNYSIAAEYNIHVGNAYLELKDAQNAIPYFKMAYDFYVKVNHEELAKQLKEKIDLLSK